MWIFAGIRETPAVRSLQECILLLTGMPEQCMEDPQASCFQRYFDACVTLPVFYLIFPWYSFSPAILRNICRKPHEEPAEATIQLSRLTEKEASFFVWHSFNGKLPIEDTIPHGNNVFSRRNRSQRVSLSLVSLSQRKTWKSRNQTKTLGWKTWRIMVVFDVLHNFDVIFHSCDLWLTKSGD